MTETVGPKKQSNSTCLGLGILGVLLLACLGGVAWFYSTYTPHGPAAATAPGAIDAFVMSQQFVTGELKAPKTAQFPDYSDPAVRVVNVNVVAGRWSVTAYVDSQNSFGALIRTQYVAVLDFIGNDKWRLVSLTYPGSQ